MRECRSFINEAGNIADRTGDRALKAEGLVLLARVETWDRSWRLQAPKSNSGPANIIERLYRKALELEKPAGLSENRAFALIELGKFYLLYAGKMADARQLAGLAIDQGRRMRDRYWLELALRLKALIAVHDGEWEQFHDIWESSPSYIPVDKRRDHFRGHFYASYFLRGDAGQLLNELDLLLDGDVQNQPEETRLSIYAELAGVVAWHIGDLRRLERAEDIAKSLIPSVDTVPFVHGRIHQCLGYIAVVRRDSESAACEYAELKDSLLLAHGRRLLALLANTAGDFPRADELFEDDLKVFRGGYRPYLAWTCFDYATALLERDQKKHAAKAQTLLQEGLLLADSLQMKLLAPRIRIQLSKYSAAVPKQ